MMQALWARQTISQSPMAAVVVWKQCGQYWKWMGVALLQWNFVCKTRLVRSGPGAVVCWHSLQPWILQSRNERSRGHNSGCFNNHTPHAHLICVSVWWRLTRFYRRFHGRDYIAHRFVKPSKCHISKFLLFPQAAVTLLRKADLSFWSLWSATEHATSINLLPGSFCPFPSSRVCLTINLSQDPKRVLGSTLLCR